MTQSEIMGIMLSDADPALPRFDFVGGEWVKVGPSVKREPNPEYISVPVSEEAADVWGVTPASSTPTSSPASCPTSGQQF